MARLAMDNLPMTAIDLIDNIDDRYQLHAPAPKEPRENRARIPSVLKAVSRMGTRPGDLRLEGG